KYWNGNEYSVLNTLRPEAVGGSHINYFSDLIFSLKKVVPLVINPGRGGAGLTYDSSVSPKSSNWSETGTLRLNAISLIDEVVAMTDNLPIVALWCQGERDAQYMDSTPAYTPEICKAAMQDVIDWWQTD